MSEPHHHILWQTAGPVWANGIDVICDAFEEVWLRGEEPTIDDYLLKCDAATRDPLLAELILVDREYRVRQGENADRQFYLYRFPAYSAALNSFDFPTIGDHKCVATTSTNSRSPIGAGDTIANFELLELLGAGASGKVWKALDLRLQRIVALKIPHQAASTDDERKRFLREAQACAKLRHPNIVSVYEIREHGNEVFIVAEFIDGTSLRDYLRQYQPTPNMIASLATQMADALHHVHEQGVIHRDLKPANVLVDREGRPHITDFGLAKWTDRFSCITLEGNVLGTPSYMAPEQARGNVSEVDRRADVYGLGALVYEMLAGSPPFSGDIASVVHQVIHSDPPRPSKLRDNAPRDLETICLKALEKQPSRRYPSAQEMAVDLRRFLRDEPIFGRRTNPFQRGWRWLSRRPAIVASLLLSLIAVGSFTVAGNLASKNRELLGLRKVTITTEPSGARIAYVPLRKDTGELQTDKKVCARRQSPNTTELSPGDYLVIAVMPDGRFHEVFRHVPEVNEVTPWPQNHRFWTISDDRIVLPKIAIPSDEITMTMAFIEGDDNFQMGVSDSTLLPIHRVSVNSFYVDPTEFTFGDYRRLYKRPARPDGSSLIIESDDTAMCVSYDDAVDYAEDAGKRLPTEAEFEFMATCRGQSNYPWGDDFPDVTPQTSLGAVKTPLFDRLAMTPPVYGLCSNVAEWTNSWLTPYPPRAPLPGLATLQERRVVRGGNLSTVAGNATISSDVRNPRNRIELPRYTRNSGLGFRCVRSARPLLTFDEIR